MELLFAWASNLLGEHLLLLHLLTAAALGVLHVGRELLNERGHFGVHFGLLLGIDARSAGLLDGAAATGDSADAPNAALLLAATGIPYAASALLLHLLMSLLDGLKVLSYLLVAILCELFRFLKRLADILLSTLLTTTYATDHCHWDTSIYFCSVSITLAESYCRVVAQSKRWVRSP